VFGECPMFEKSLFSFTFVAAISSGLVAGIFYAFSSFVMPALARVPVESGINAMNMINVTVITPSFMLIFIGTGLLCFGLMIGGYFYWRGFDSALLIISSLIYLVGCIGVTMTFNVPLNDTLAVVLPGTQEAAGHWLRFLNEWVMWNHVRGGAALVSAIMFTWVLIRTSTL
jgi:uncharacterized membrane protein